MSRRRTFVALHICTVVLFLFILLLQLPVVFFSWFLSRMPKDIEHMGQLFAVVDGEMAGWMFCLGACCLISAMRVRCGDRVERLMIKFHDELGREAHDIKPTSPDSQQSKPDRKTITDEQYVAGVRRAMQWTRWISLAFFCIAVVCLSMFLVVLRHHRVELNAFAYKDTWRGLAIGLCGGALAGLALAGFVGSMTSAGQYIFRHRTERLMLRFHDERRLAEGQQEAH
jgi:uncharacterized integral membrane protein